MKKIFKSISASVTAFIIASTMVVSASAASSADVVSAAKSAGVPSNHVSELKNYLDSHASKFSSADYDYMVKALSDCGAKYVQPVADKLFGAGTDLASLTNDQLRQVFKEMGEDSRKAIADACVATGKHFGVTIKGRQSLQARIGTSGCCSDGNTNIGTNTGNGSLNTGANSMTAVQVAAVLTLALSAFGITVAVKEEQRVLRYGQERR